MNLFDIIGPVMVGPSSSHTAGAVKIGRVCQRLLAEDVRDAKIYFHGSFQATGKGHGTDRALVAGTALEWQWMTRGLPESFAAAQEAGLTFTMEGLDLGDVHPNSGKIGVDRSDGKKVRGCAALRSAEDGFRFASWMACLLISAGTARR